MYMVYYGSTWLMFEMILAPLIEDLCILVILGCQESEQRPNRIPFSSINFNLTICSIAYFIQ